MLPAVEKRNDYQEEDKKDEQPPDAAAKVSDRPSSANPNRL